MMCDIVGWGEGLPSPYCITMLWKKTDAHGRRLDRKQHLQTDMKTAAEDMNVW